MFSARDIFGGPTRAEVEAFRYKYENQERWGWKFLRGVNSLDIRSPLDRKSPGMLRTLSLSMIFLALFSIGGGPRYTLQMVAWAGMLIDYSQKSGIVVAVAETFDGQHPCQMCKNIESAKKSDTSETLLKAEKKDKNLEQAAVVGLTHACSALIVVEMPRLLRAQFVSAPETGPPRMG